MLDFLPLTTRKTTHSYLYSHIHHPDKPAVTGTKPTLAVGEIVSELKIQLWTAANIELLTSPPWETNSKFTLQSRGWTLYTLTPRRLLCAMEYINKGKRFLSSKVCKLNSIENQTKGYMSGPLSTSSEFKRKYFILDLAEVSLQWQLIDHRYSANKAKLINIRFQPNVWPEKGFKLVFSLN